jgi:ribosome maturation factor RimP
VKSKRKNKRKKKNGAAEKPVPFKKAAEIIASVRVLAEPLCESEGMELIHIEYQPETGGQILRLYIDKPGGVTLDDCVYISRQLGDLLDVGMTGMGSYHLEVSSPGSERPLSRRADFDRFKGEIVKIKTNRPMSGRKNFTGTLMGIAGEMIEINTEDGAVTIPFKDVNKARLAKV